MEIMNQNNGGLDMNQQQNMNNMNQNMDMNQQPMMNNNQQQQPMMDNNQQQMNNMNQNNGGMDMNQQQPLNTAPQQNNQNVGNANMPYNYPQYDDGRGGKRNQMRNVSTIKKTSSCLCEISGSIELTPFGPQPIAFFMMVPGQPDNTKKSGRTYLMEQKISMKFDSHDLFALAKCLETGTPFEKFTDPAKSAHTQGTGDTKKVTTSQGNNGFFLNFNYGQQRVGLSLKVQECFGFAGQIQAFATLLEFACQPYWEEYSKRKAIEAKQNAQNNQNGYGNQNQNNYGGMNQNQNYGGMNQQNNYGGMNQNQNQNNGYNGMGGTGY